ncbi:uncharacterized protein [Onthophagus taurus]|uniref:uncharacterized protein n=1 Tax=Onthophagus taurus TaxID=166361 RepID=UPI0039BE964C
MIHTKKILLIIGIFYFNQAVTKVFERCELARELVDLHEIPINQVATWICIVEHESNYNTSAVNKASGDHGLFQISHLYWCSPPGNGFACGLPCSSFEDEDIEDDVVCARRIFRAHQRMTGNGFSAWVAYNHHCRWDVNKYIKGCFEKLRITTEKDDNETIKEEINEVETTTIYLKVAETTDVLKVDKLKCFLLIKYILKLLMGEITVDTPKMIFLFLLFPYVLTSGKIYTKCQLAKELLHIHQISFTNLGTWVCIATYESGLNTSAVGSGGQYYGIFQISKEYWCYPGKGCDLLCDHLIDDNISDDVMCAKKIYNETLRRRKNGFLAWAGYYRCKDAGDKYISNFIIKILHILHITYLTSQYPVFYVKPIMISLKYVMFIISSITITTGKIYDHCELANELLNKYNFPQDQIATWVCIAFKESSYNTAEVSEDGHDFGLFQIDNQYWCSPPGTGCGVSCDQLLDDDISDDVKCVKTIFDVTQQETGNGFSAWATYPMCQDNVNSYIDGCFRKKHQKSVKSPKMGVGKIHLFHLKPIMTSFKYVIFIISMITITTAKIYDRCDLARDLLYKYNFPKGQIATWVCIAYRESTYNTAAKSSNGRYFGLFQIYNKYWCSPPGTGCGVSCDQMLNDDISDDVKCVRTIFDVIQKEQGNGFLAWSTYSNCKNNVNRYTDGCF